VTLVDTRTPILVVGIGSTMRGDDGIGPQAIDALRKRLAVDAAVDVGTSDIELLVLDGEAARLIEAFRDRSLTIVLDAIRAGAAPGTIHRVDPATDQIPAPGGAASTHTGGVAEAIALAAALDRLSGRVVVLGIEPASFELGADLSSAAAAALPGLVDRVVGEIGAMVSITRQQLKVTGVVQGVGFRPCVQRLATRFGLGGTVRNTSGSVRIEVEGSEATVSRFRDALAAEAPPAAKIAAIDVLSATTELVPADDVVRADFAIVASDGDDHGVGALPPDAAPCSECLFELDDPSNRRYQHPFISCTQCGPRFTIARAMPYDRHTTTMADFAMCPDCQTEYDDPTDRRFHAQPISCWSCGPSLIWEQDGVAMSGRGVIAAAVARLAAGCVVAIKGVGGYHLAVDAGDAAAVGRLRTRKQRPDKPFGVMVAGVEAAHRYAVLNDAEVALLEGGDRPIVLARRRADAPLAEVVALRSPMVGIMLPSSPIHHLLFAAGPPRGPAALVMTSGNVSGEPICHDDADASGRLSGIVDGFLRHDRRIHQPCDDSVVRLIGDTVVPIRRSRGAVPSPIQLPFDSPPLLACGGDLKNVFAYAEHRNVWLSQHIGDLASIDAQNVMASTASLLEDLSGTTPGSIVTDAHSGYHSRRYGRRLAAADAAVRPIDADHHHAHAAALMADHGLDIETTLLTFVFDGTGLGPDGSLWGGEVLRARYDSYERVAHLAPLPLPGGDQAARHPCRTALAYLAALGLDWDGALAPVQACDPLEQKAIGRQVPTAPTTSSMGRLFDVVASLLDVRHRVTYEGQAAIELEYLAMSGRATVPLVLTREADGVIDPAPLLRGVIEALRSGSSAADIAASFHAAVVAMIVECAELGSFGDDRRVGLTGGVFQNELLVTGAREALSARGFAVLIHQQVPANDAGLALGQAAIAAARANQSEGEN